MYSTLVFLSLLSSAFGFLVTRPSLTQGWTNQGPQTIEFQRVSTDAQNFTVVLTSLNRQQLPNDIVLVPFFDATSASSLSVPAPSSGWPTPGGSYRVNLVRSATETTSIYAQSSEFNITAGGATSTSKAAGTTAGTTISPGAVGTGAANAAPATGTGSAQGAASTEDFTAPGVSGASPSKSLAAGLITGAVGLLAVVLL